MASKPKRNYLTLKKKVDVIKTAEKNRGMSIRELGEQFDCGLKHSDSKNSKKQGIYYTVLIRE